MRALPGGLDAVANFTAELRASGVRVLWPYFFWDTGTRREPNGRADSEVAVELLKQTGAVGLNCGAK